MRGAGRAQALRDAGCVRNEKMVMIESPSSALHAAAAGRTNSAERKTEDARQARSGGARGYACG
ncbi:hypothetical protein C6Q35_21845 [Burkholderia multivorans]|nr:hypothetical protein C6Q35_21845 [Burkholderia multivorans]